MMDFDLPPGGRVMGVGIDTVECSRIDQAIQRHGDRFLKRIYTEQEIEYCYAMRNPVPHLAARFAAKEAVSKAFTTGIGKHLGWRSIEILKGVRNEPLVQLDQQGLALLEHLQGSAVLISLSHTENVGQAVALLLSA